MRPVAFEILGQPISFRHLSHSSHAIRQSSDGSSGAVVTRANSKENKMNAGVKTILYPTRDLAGAKKIFEVLLGVKATADAPYYVGFDAGGQHIGLVPGGHDNKMTGPVPFWHVDDIEGASKAIQAAGGAVREPIHDVGGGRRVATLLDGDGNAIGLLQDPS